MKILNLQEIILFLKFEKMDETMTIYLKMLIC